MNNNEVNKIIVEFMDWEVYPTGNDVTGYSAKMKDGGYIVELPTESLDALVPVWEKLNTFPMFDEDEKYLIELLTEDRFSEINYVWAKADVLQEAAAHATAKAIISLNNQ